MMRAGALASTTVLGFLATACSSGGSKPPIMAGDSAVPMDAAAPDDGGPAPPPDMGSLDLPMIEAPPADAPGVALCATGSDVPGVSPPPGFCLRRYATVKVARTLVLAPNGDLFVGAPNNPTAGGAAGGPGAIVVLSDDDRDGVAELHTFADGLPDVHGLALGGGYLYFTTTSTVWRTPYTAGQRRETGPRENMGLPASFGTGGRWTHGLALSTSGRLFASRGQYNTCGPTPGGEISQLTMGSQTVISTGFRNPMYMRCHQTDDVCAATELGEDQMPGAREKLIMIRPSTNYGYPCCYTTSRPVPAPMGMNCAAVTTEDAEFVLADTPFGFDWERGLWPAPYNESIFVALHGSFYTQPPWGGARLVFATVDPATRKPIKDASGKVVWRDFLSGFGPGGTMLERPSDITFATDGRMFFSDDQGGAVYWMAPVSLLRP